MRLENQPLFRSALLCTAFLLTVLAITLVPDAVHSQQATTAPVTVEAIQLAKVRSAPGINNPEIGQIVAGTAYPLIGRSALYPWYLIQLPDKQGWVYADLVKVTGNPLSVPVTEKAVEVGPTLTMTPSPAGSEVVAAGAGETSPNVPAQASTTPLASYGVTVEALSEARVRYGPGTDFQRVGMITKGTSYVVLRRHSLYPWLEIEYDAIASKRAWVSQQTVKITGNIFAVPTTDEHSFDYPTLTPTPAMIVAGVSPWNSQPPVEDKMGDSPLTQLGKTVYGMLLQGGFEPFTEREGSVFVLDLRTQQAISLNPGVAYSGASMMKIAVLLSYYRKASIQPDKSMAGVISNMMVCSENNASNAVLNYLGNRDEAAGAKFVTDTVQQLGLKDTFLTRQFNVGKVAGTATPTARPEQAMKTDADQLTTEPDTYNQTTPADLGWLLGSIYQCALDGSGPISTAFGGEVTMMECRHIINAMRADKIGALVEAGVPAGMAVAHKHGWTDDTHGDAALLITPGGDYVLVTILHNRTWLKSDESFPLIAEISRLTYNTFNPGTPLDKIHPQPVPADCTFGDDLIANLQSPDLPPIN
jgi:uncharacterized protein YraI/beta-lactamase class A